MKKFIYVRLNMYINIFHGRDQKQLFKNTHLLLSNDYYACGGKRKEVEKKKKRKI